MSTYKKSLLSVLSSFILILLLSACASQHQKPTLPDSYRLETDDLATTTQLVQMLGKQVPVDRILVVFDIDNTLLSMNTDLGSDQWYDWQKNLQKTDKCDPRLVASRLDVQGALYFAGSMRPTQTDAADVISKLQTMGVQVMAETARGWNFALPTFRELRRNGMAFGHSAPAKNLGKYQPETAKRPLIYQDGVYLLAGQHKGDMLLDLLKHSGQPMPAAIIAVDDKDYNLDAYEQTGQRESWNLYTLHYTGVQDWVENFNPQKAESDWQQVRGALREIQQIFGDHNFRLTEKKLDPDCAGTN